LNIFINSFIHLWLPNWIYYNIYSCRKEKYTLPISSKRTIQKTPNKNEAGILGHDHNFYDHILLFSFFSIFHSISLVNSKKKAKRENMIKHDDHALKYQPRKKNINVKLSLSSWLFKF